MLTNNILFILREMYMCKLITFNSDENNNSKCISICECSVLHCDNSRFIRILGRYIKNKLYFKIV